jgi:drug/metabolite transporter (DMT)-like permease
MQDNQRHDSAATAPSWLRRTIDRPRTVVTNRWERMDRLTRGAALVSAGSLTLVVMATLVKYLGSNKLPAMEILFFRSFVGFLFVLPLFASNPMEPLRTKRFGMHFTRGTIGAIGNMLFFWTITNLLLADAMALQFSRPLFMIPLAVLFLGEAVGLRRSLVSVIGFLGIVLYARPFMEGFNPGTFVGAAGALTAAMVVIGIKRLQTTESTRVIMFYYAFWAAAFTLIPTIMFWVTPTLPQLALLIMVGFLGISGQGLITHGLSMGEASVLAPLDYSRIVYSAALGYLLFGEIPGPLSFVGMALIVASSLYLMLTEKRRPPRAQPAPGNAGG